MPTRHFLNQPEPLERQVAGFIGKQPAGRTLLITPTAGAARRIENQLLSSGTKPPANRQPMQALLPETDNQASPVERSLAWAEAIGVAGSETLQALFWKRSPATTAERLKAGRNFIRLADLLAEGGHSPASLQLDSDTARWAAIAELYQTYLKQLEAWQLEDPNEIRLREIKAPSAAIDHLVIAGTPDLPHAFSLYASALEEGGTKVDLLAWNPGDLPPDHFDDWGRPIPEIWKDRLIHVSDAQLHVAASAQDEARSSISHVINEDAALVSIDPAQEPLLASELLANGRQAYLPEGTPLIRCEAAKLAIEWDEFQRNKDLRSLRRLLELPAFCRALDPENPITQADALSAIDHLLGETVASSLEGGWAASPALPDEAKVSEKEIRAKVRRVLGTVLSLLSSTAFDLLERAFPGSEDERPEPVRKVIQIGKELGASPATKGQTPPVQILTQAIGAEHLQAPAPDNSISLNGWLEAPWLGDVPLVLCGCIEGRMPKNVDGDAFLPDSLRPALGIGGNDQRLARDAYLLHALLSSRPVDALQISFSKYNGDGDPNRPSRLLLRTPLEELPARIRKVAQAGSSTRERPSRRTEWRWQLPGPLPERRHISPTAFSNYLTCPFRFCMEKVLRLEPGAQAAREMDAAVFGNLIHKALENFGREIIPTGDAMLRLDEQTIRARVQELLDEEALRLFGPQPAPAVRIQLASATTRINAFARVQADCFAQGWMITDAERRLKPEGEDLLKIGPLPLSGMIDRIEKHIETGAMRIMDYKTFSARKEPAKTHLGPASHKWLEAAGIEVEGKQRTWTNLQLPLYRHILEHWYPEECKAHVPKAAYFVLPSDPNETVIDHFTELDETEVYQSALRCAEAVAGQIHKGVFWPPQPFRGSWDDPLEPLFSNGSPEDCIAPETIERLKGGQP